MTEQDRSRPDGTEDSAEEAMHVDGRREGDERASEVAPSDAIVASEPDRDSEASFFIVGVGASAGGLEALSALIRNIKLHSMALIVVQHLARTHDSVLPTLLARASPIDVLTATEGMKVEPNHIYVIPPNTDLALLNGTLHLMEPPTGRALRLPIDFFFRSLAEDQGARGVGVILSGTGTDGTFGLKAIKQAGGLTFVQEPSTAKYDGMPRSALDSGFADACLPPQAIADELMRIGRHPYLARAVKQQALGVDNVAKLLISIRSAFGTDLTNYKTNTIERRIGRRMALQKIEQLDDYVKFAHSNADELRALYDDMLIGVTSFFRDPEAFEALKTKVFPGLLEGRPSGAPIRVWVPACSTGEEAYSIAICLLEYFKEKGGDHRIQIFGTDVDERAIQRARRGVYPLNIALDVAPGRLQEFFVKRDSEFQVTRQVRDAAVFSQQNILKDAPFSKLDLVSCRNLLIYLQPIMQKRVLRILHYALNPDGYLFLGNSETVGDSPELFSLFDGKQRIYRSKQAGPVATIDTSLGVQPQHAEVPRSGGTARAVVNLAAIADRKILEIYDPVGVVLNENLDVLHVRGRIEPFLALAPGLASLSVLKLARPEVQLELRRATKQALSDNTRVTARCKLQQDGDERPFKLDVAPITDPETKTRCLLVLFHDLGPVQKAPTPPQDESASPWMSRCQELERELMVTKEYLQSTIEELESTNEELKSSNEELQSSNEELQSTNEELETSKEEMQSTNEELTTVNDELCMRMDELRETNDDLYNVLTGVDNAVVILDIGLKIRRFTHVAEKLLTLAPHDVGRPVSLLDPFVKGLRLEEVSSGVIATLTPFSQELECTDGRWHSLRILPYRTLDHSIKGVVIVLADIEVQRRAQLLGEELASYAGKFLAIVSHPLAIIDGRMRVVWVNDAFYKTFQVVAEETIGDAFTKIGAGQWTDEKLLRQIEGTTVTGAAFRDQLVRRVFPDIGPKTIRVSGSRLPPMGGDSGLVLLAFEEQAATVSR